MNRVILSLITLAILQVGCAFKSDNIYVPVAWVIGDSAINCAYREDGTLIGGHGCIAGGVLSEQGARAIEAIERAKEAKNRAEAIEEEELIEEVEE